MLSPDYNPVLLGMGANSTFPIRNYYPLDVKKLAAVPEVLEGLEATKVDAILNRNTVFCHSFWGKKIAKISGHNIH